MPSKVWQTQWTGSLYLVRSRMSVAARFTEFKSRSASVRASSWNPEDRTIEVVFLDSESIVRKN